MSLLVSPQSAMNDAAEAFGVVHNKHTQPPDPNRDTFQCVRAGQSLSVLFKPLSGLLNRDKMLPLGHAPVALERKLADDPADPVFTATTRDGAKTANNTSLLWEINKVQVKADV